MRSTTLIIGAALVAATWAAPAQAEKTVMMTGHGTAVVCDTSWVTTCWHCYNSHYTGGGWECFPGAGALAFKPLGSEQEKQLQRRDGFIVKQAPESARGDLRKAKTEYREALARNPRTSPESAVVIASIQKLSPEKSLKRRE